MAQFLRPISDRTITGSWENQAGGTTNLYQSIDEVTLSNTDYIVTSKNPGGTDLYEAGLSAGTTPNAGDHTVRYTIGKDQTGGRTMNVVIRLFNSNDTEIASWTHNNIDAETTHTQVLTAPQVSAINSYTGLYLRVNPTTTGGGAARTSRIYWAELEIPDALPDPTEQIQVGGAWKEITNMQVKQSGVWKTVSSIQRKISGVWETSQ